MDRRGVREKVPEGSGEQGKMEETGYEIICGTTTTIAIKEQMMMCCSVSSLVRWGVFLIRLVLESVVWRVECFSYTPRDEICLFVRRVVGLSYTPCAGICPIVRRVGSLCYTSG